MSRWLGKHKKQRKRKSEFSIWQHISSKRNDQRNAHFKHTGNDIQSVQHSGEISDRTTHGNGQRCSHVPPQLTTQLDATPLKCLHMCKPSGCPRATAALAVSQCHAPRDPAKYETDCTCTYLTVLWLMADDAHARLWPSKGVHVN